MAVEMLELNSSNWCNLKCQTCIRNWPSFKQERVHFLGLDDFKTIIGHFPKLPRLQICGFSEPLANKHTPDFIKLAKLTGVGFVESFTNGVFLTDEKIAKLYDAGLDLLRISVDGGDSETYRRVRGHDLEDIIGKVRHFSKNGIPVRMETTLSSLTIHSAMGLPDVAQRMGARILSIRPLDGQTHSLDTHRVASNKLGALREELVKKCRSNNIELVMPLPQEIDSNGGCKAGQEVYVDERGRLTSCYLTQEEPINLLSRNNGNSDKITRLLQQKDGLSSDCSCRWSLQKRDLFS